MSQVFDVYFFFFSKKNILPNLVIMLGLTKFRVVTNFFKGKKIITFLKFTYNNNFFLGHGGPVTTLASMWSCPLLMHNS